MDLLSEVQIGESDRSKKVKNKGHQRARRKDAEPMNLWKITVHRLSFLEKNSKDIEENVCLTSTRKYIGKE